VAVHIKKLIDKVLLARVVTIPQKLERIRRLESNKSCSVITATHDIELSTVLYKEMEVPICMVQKVSEGSSKTMDIATA
jgi:hypothetical protein